MSGLVSVVILNLEKAELTKDCINSLMDSTYPNTEVILVNNSTCDCKELDRFCRSARKKGLKIKLIQNPGNIGFAKGNNLGFHNSSGDFVFILNNDTIVEKNAIKYLVERISESKAIGAVGVKMLRMRSETIESVGVIGRRKGNITRLRAIGKNEPDKGQYNNVSEVDCIVGAAIFVPRPNIERLGLFDSRFFIYGEDLDLCWRYKRHGLKLLVEPRAEIRHFSSAIMGSPRQLSNPKIALARYLRVRNDLCTYLKNASLPELLFLPIFEARSFYNELSWSIKSRRPEFVLNKVRAYLWNIGELPKTLHQRFSVEKNREICLEF